MAIGAFTLLLLVCELSQSESACMCPSSHPQCESDGKCWKRSSHSWTWTGLACGSCTSGLSTPVAAAAAAPVAAAPSSSSSSGSCDASALSQYIANFAKGKKGQKVYSAKQGSASCWDLAWAAMENAEKDGHNPVFWQKASHWADSSAWSDEVVPLEQAKPGDIAQFKGWQEKFKGYTKMAWNPHTAVVTECYKDGVLTTYEQNPTPVHEGKYHTASKSSGSVTIYRLKSSTLRLHSQTPQLSVLGLHSGQFSVLAAVCAITGLLAFASFIVKQQRSVARSAPPTIEEGALLYPEMLDPEFVEVTAE